MRNASKLRAAGVAFFALFFLLLQPVCAMYERYTSTPQVASAASTHDIAHADGTSHGSTPCCSEIRADALASESSATAADRIFPAAEMAVALSLPLTLVARPGLILRSRSTWSAPPPLPYYARSARILR